MSILLDALRKSEQSQRRGAVPTLDTELPPAPPRRRSPGWLALLVPIALAAAAAGWWFGVRSPGAAAVDERPGAVAVEAERAASAGAPAVSATEKPASGDAAVAFPAVDRKAGAGQAGSAPGGGETRTPVERPVAPLERPPTAAGQAAALAATGDEAGGGAASGGPEAGVADDPSSGADGGPAQREVIPDPAATLDAPPEAAPATTAAAAEGPWVGEPVGLWALPADVRERLPEFRVSVLVYAARPGDRFALVNGKRLGEGDALSAGLELVEIRRDGAVFTFERYRFLVGR